MQAEQPIMAETAADKKQHEQWEAEEDLRTLQRATEIRGDKKRMARAKRQAKKVLTALSSG